jgi:hypothetical protein
MGVTFRTGGYIRFVRIGGRTIKDGEAAAVWNRSGTHSQIIGPRRVNLFYSTIRFLTRHKAESHQYLVVKNRNGEVDHMHGPEELYENPAYHDEVSVEDAILLKVQRCIIVHTDGSSALYTAETINTRDGHKKVKVEYQKGSSCGARLFIPRPDEKIHFSRGLQLKGGSYKNPTLILSN